MNKIIKETRNESSKKEHVSKIILYPVFTTKIELYQPKLGETIHHMLHTSKIILTNCKREDSIPFVK